MTISNNEIVEVGFLPCAIAKGQATRGRRNDKF